jgi:deoxyribodipyrimidine photolyase-related protein
MLRQPKRLLILSAMRSEADALLEAGHRLRCTKLEEAGSRSFMSLLGQHIDGRGYEERLHFEVDSPRTLASLEDLCRSHGLRRVSVETPMFLTSREDFSRYRRRYKRLFMADFCRWQRKRMGVLIDEGESPQEADGASTRRTERSCRSSSYLPRFTGRSGPLTPKH